MSSDDEDDVKLYDPLAHNLKRQRVFVSLSSSESEDDGDDDDQYDDGKSASSASTFRKRLRGNGTTASPAKAKASDTVVVDDDEEIYADDLLTDKEREKQRENERKIQALIDERMAHDALLNQTRAVMSNANMARAQPVVSLDSDDDDDDVVLLPHPNGTSASHAPPPPASSSTPTAGQSKGERITLQVRSNGTETDSIAMFSKEPFSVLYERFCDLHGLPRSAVHMSLDGENLNLTDTPHASDLDSGDLIDAKVDFSKADADKKKRLVRLLLKVEGRKPEKFRIDATSTLEKLHMGFCRRHQIADPDDVEMTLRGDRLRLEDTVEVNGLFDGDVINVEIKNFVDPASIELSVRYNDKLTKPHLVVPSHKVATLVSQVADHLNVDTSRISLRLDGEDMKPSESLQYYELEGGEIIDVKVQS